MEVEFLTHTYRRLLDTELSLPPDTENRTQNTYISETTFDTNMVIILAALLCALVIALGLNSIVRCMMRCSERFAWHGPERAAARLAATGLKKRDLRRLPVVVFGSSSDADVPATECPICLGEFEEGEKVRVLPRCHHGFHVKCIDTWLVSHSSCPNCRISLLDRPTGSKRVEEGARRTWQQDNDVSTAPATVARPAATEHGGVEVVVDERPS